MSEQTTIRLGPAPTSLRDIFCQVLLDASELTAGRTFTAALRTPSVPETDIETLEIPAETCSVLPFENIAYGMYFAVLLGTDPAGNTATLATSGVIRLGPIVQLSVEPDMSEFIRVNIHLSQVAINDIAMRKGWMALYRCTEFENSADINIRTPLASDFVQSLPIEANKKFCDFNVPAGFGPLEARIFLESTPEPFRPSGRLVFNYVCADYIEADPDVPGMERRTDTLPTKCVVKWHVSKKLISHSSYVGIFNASECLSWKYLRDGVVDWDAGEGSLELDVSKLRLGYYAVRFFSAKKRELQHLAQGVVIAHILE